MKKPHLWKASTASAAALILTFGALLSGSVAASATVDEVEIPRAPVTLSADELSDIGASQDAAEIDKIIAMASPDQNVQVLLNFETKEYDAAVLVDQSADEQLKSHLAKVNSEALLQEGSVAENMVALAGVYLCSYTSGPKGTSYHNGGTLFWCGSGSWSGSQPGWYQYYNGIATNTLVGPSNLSWQVCPGYTTCTVSPTTTLGYVSFN